MSASYQTSVIIAGAGPVGLGLACELADASPADPAGIVEQVRGAAAPAHARGRPRALAIEQLR
jgi:2-polyprenyl-6-methoxyphenol hydroxylase-like FAD-dependent oxidoreductase